MTTTSSDLQKGTNAVEATLTASRALLGVVARSLVTTLQDVTMPQFRVLVILTSGGPLRMKTLADRMGALPSTFTRALDRMVERGWIERVASATDRREILVRATPQGRAIVDEVTERRRTELSRILARVSPDDQVILQRGLEIFSTAAQENAPEDLIILGL